MPRRRDYLPAARLIHSYEDLAMGTRFGTRKDGRVYPKRRITGKAEMDRYFEKLGREEAARFKGRLNKSLRGRIVDEVRDYDVRYGLASPADVVVEINTRGRNLRFQGELYYYAYTNLREVTALMDEMVREGLLEKVDVEGSRGGYRLARRGRR